MFRLAAILLFCFFSFPGTCQLKKIKSLKISGDIKTAAVDRPGDLYLIFNNGTIEKISTEGKLQYSVSHASPPDIFDPRDGARIFAYYRSTQQYAFLSPTLNITYQNKIDEAFAISPYLTCSFGDQHILILDSADWSLKKIHAKTSVVSFEADARAILSARKELTAMREYQNFIFFLDPDEGILVFNAIGKLLKIIEAKGISYFNFLGEELYYLQNNKLKLFDLFSAERREIDLPAAGDFAFLTDERFYLINKNQVDVFTLKR